MSITASVVVTTIFDPVVLESYFHNFEKYGHLDDVDIYVIPDRKTPAQAYERCLDLSRRGLKVTCPTLEEQNAFLGRVDFSANLIPFNSDNRRNVGYLMALDSGSDFIISIDDDNYCRPEEDFFLEHAVVCQQSHMAETVNTATGWFNICSLLTLDGASVSYPRGFPYYARHKQEHPDVTSRQCDVEINAGLWLINPDVDAISWLVNPARAESFSGRCLVLGEQAWSPINTQNTALRRDVVAAYYYAKMKYDLTGLIIDRYGDIFSGYFAQACVRHLGRSIRIGTPIVDHKRNSHNYLDDAVNELAGIILLEDLLPWLIEARLEGNTYHEAYQSLSYALEEAVGKFKGKIWNEATRGYFHQMSYCMREWVKACKLIG
jgi:hypothetical protein